MREICTSSLKRGRDIARKHGMQSLGTYGETQKHALLKPTLTAVPSLLYPQTVLLRGQALAGFESGPQMREALNQ